MISSQNTISQEILDSFISLAQQTFGSNLVGIYLHGSAAMGCYNPQKSDLDLIVVVQDPLTTGEKRAFMDGVVALHEKTPAKGIEMSVVTRDVCKPFLYPTPFELHFSEGHRDWYQCDPEDYVAKMNGTDKDLAAHCTVIRARGKTLYGLPIEEMFGEVPPENYFDSLWYDVGNAREEILDAPMYLTLNLARVLAYIRERKVLSKQEGGVWALQRLPEKYHPLIKTALQEYTDGADVEYSKELALQYADEMLCSIAKEKDGSYVS